MQHTANNDDNYRDRFTAEHARKLERWAKFDPKTTSEGWEEFQRKAFNPVQSPVPPDELEETGECRDYDAGYAEGKADATEAGMVVINRLQEQLDRYEAVIRFYAPQEVACRTIGNNSFSEPELALRPNKSERRGWRDWVVSGLLTVVIAVFWVFACVGAYHTCAWLATNLIP
jgi:hypothetical protein